jgi:hypothetical protein
MKRLIKKSLVLTKLFVIVFVVFMTSAGAAHAYDTAKLDIEISGSQKNKYYLCLSNVGCVRIESNKQSLPIDALDVRYIFVANASTYQIYPQNLPESCHVTVNGNQKLVVKGNLAKAANDKVYIANLHCAVS